jgi:uncharacterized RDD family membrane protein YckC
MSYAGFWKRFLASILDTLVLLVVLFIFLILLTLWFAALRLYTPDDTLLLMFTILLVLIGSTIRLFYFALMESGPTQATLGKMAVGIKVTDLDGNRLDPSKAVLRHLAKLLSEFTLGVGYVMAGFSPKKQALHDMIAGCLVVDK